MGEKIKIGISIGDVNGIGLEIIIKTLADSRIYEYCTPIVYGHTKVASFYRRTTEVEDLNFFCDQPSIGGCRPERPAQAKHDQLLGRGCKD